MDSFARELDEAGALVEFIDAYRGRFSVEPVCAALEFPMSREGNGSAERGEGPGGVRRTESVATVPSLMSQVSSQLRWVMAPLPPPDHVDGGAVAHLV